MNPHDKAAFTGALKAAVTSLDDQARAEFVAWAKALGVKSTEPALGGTLTVASRDRKVSLLADDFEEWVGEHEPHNLETVTRVRPAAEKAILARLAIADDTVVWKDTGEVCTFAVVAPEGAAYASWRGGDDAKGQVTDWLASRFEAVAELLAGDTKAVES